MQVCLVWFDSPGILGLQEEGEAQMGGKGGGEFSGTDKDTVLQNNLLHSRQTIKAPEDELVATRAAHGEKRLELQDIVNTERLKSLRRLSRENLVREKACRKEQKTLKLKCTSRVIRRAKSTRRRNTSLKQKWQV